MTLQRVLNTLRGSKIPINKGNSQGFVSEDYSNCSKTEILAKETGVTWWRGEPVRPGSDPATGWSSWWRIHVGRDSGATSPRKHRAGP